MQPLAYSLAGRRRVRGRSPGTARHNSWARRGRGGQRVSIYLSYVLTWQRDKQSTWLARASYNMLTSLTLLTMQSD